MRRRSAPLATSANGRRRHDRAAGAAARALGRLSPLVRRRGALGRRLGSLPRARCAIERELDRADAFAFRAGPWTLQRLQPYATASSRTLDPERIHHLPVLLGVDRDRARSVGRGTAVRRGLLGVLPADRDRVPRRRRRARARSKSRRRPASESCARHSPRCSRWRRARRARGRAIADLFARHEPVVRACTERRHAGRRSRGPTVAPARNRRRRRAAHARRRGSAQPTLQPRRHAASSTNASTPTNGTCGSSTSARPSSAGSRRRRPTSASPTSRPTAARSCSRRTARAATALWSLDARRRRRDAAHRGARRRVVPDRFRASDRSPTFSIAARESELRALAARTASRRCSRRAPKASSAPSWRPGGGVVVFGERDDSAGSRLQLLAARGAAAC